MSAERPSLPVLFLDIDGVLNGHEYDKEAESSTIKPECVARLNRVLGQTACSVVISSAWRYMVIGGAMKLTGFEYMLRTHGTRLRGRILGHTAPDVDVEDDTERGKQIKAWLQDHPEVTRYAVVDDNDFGFEGMPFVQTDGTKGLSDQDADMLIDYLWEGVHAVGRGGGLPQPQARLAPEPPVLSLPGPRT